MTGIIATFIVCYFIFGLAVALNWHREEGLKLPKNRYGFPYWKYATKQSRITIK